jgi:hypothetical protein
MYSVFTNVLDIDALKALLQLAMYMNLGPYCPHLLPNVGEIRPKRAVH